MKLTRIGKRRSGVRPHVGAAPRLTEPVVSGKRNRAVALLAGLPVAACALVSVGSASDAWHVGPVPEVRAICHAGDSLWVGTSAGVFVLDIRNGSLVDHIVAGERLPSSSVRAIAARRDSVFVGTDAGLVCLARGSATVWTARSPGKLGAVPLGRINDISFASRGDWFLSTGGGGMGVVTRAGGYAFTKRDSLLSDNVYGVMERPGGVQWIATAAGLCARADDTTLVSFQAGAGIPRGEVRQIVGGERAAYLLVSGRGVFRFDGARATAVEPPAKLSLREALRVSYGADGSLWAVGGEWVAVWRGGKWSRVTVPDADEHESWRVVVADGAGAFVGSARGVVLGVGRGGSFRVELPGLLPSPRVSSICPDGRGGAWMVSGGRVVRADVRTKRVTVETEPLAAQSVVVLRSGAVVSAGRWTVRRLQNGVWEDLGPDVPETDPSFTVARAGERDEVWVGTSEGSLYRYDGVVWLRVARGGDLVGRGAVLDAFVARGDIWGRVYGGTATARSGRWHRPEGMDSTVTVADVAMSPAGDWIAVSPRGLFRMDAERARWVAASALEIVGGKPGRSDPIPGAGAAVFDASGNLYLGTANGVARVSANGVTWVGALVAGAATEITDLAIDDHHLWIGFAQEGLSVVALDTVR